MILRMSQLVDPVLVRRFELTHTILTATGRVDCLRVSRARNCMRIPEAGGICRAAQAETARQSCQRSPTANGSCAPCERKGRLRGVVCTKASLRI